MVSRWNEWRQRLGMQELLLLCVLALVAGGVWGFLELADEVNEGSTLAMDKALLLALRDPADPGELAGPPWLEEVVRDFTALGSGSVLVFLTLSVVGYLILLRRYTLALLVVVAVGGGLLLSLPLKAALDRQRPDLVPALTEAHFASFPSGHSMAAAATYLTLGALIARVQPRRRLRIYFLALSVLVTLLVGVSRVYLGVHWPTDVVAGWTAGATWALLCGLAAWGMQWRQGRS
jgi:undecaprenyl-diphosphatase